MAGKPETIWTNCYDDSWQGQIVPEAFSHPAKMSYSLLIRIIQHIKQKKWAKKGSVILDPFGGIGSTAILGAYNDYRVICVELEEKFCNLATGYDCDGTVELKTIEIEKEEIISPAEPGGWYVRLRLLAAYWAADKKIDYGGDTAFTKKGFETEKDANEFADTLPDTFDERYTRDCYTVIYEESKPEEKILAGSTKTICVRKSKCGKEFAHEPHHVKGNFELHANKWTRLGCPKPVMIQGDSRQLCQIIEKADLIVSSPPFNDGGMGDKRKFGGMKNTERWENIKYLGGITNYGQTPGQLGCMKPGNIDAIISSPPYAESMSSEKSGIDWTKTHREDGSIRDMTKEPAHKTRHGAGAEMRYGPTKQNLGNLKPGDIDLVLSSPPYAEQQEGGGIAKSVQGESDYPVYDGMARTKKAGRAAKGAGYQNQGNTKGNLGNLKAGDVEVILSSPPYEGSNQNYKNGYSFIKTDRKYEKEIHCGQAKYGNSKGQLGQEQGETFWQAAKQIVEQCFQILRPGGHAIWVVKDFVRAKKRVDFTGDWERLCNSVGFKTVCKHKAMLVKEDVKQSLFGDKIVNRKERKSFFRRLSESKGSPKIDWEMVICMRK